MKKWMIGLVVLTLAVPAMAQLAGLPIAGGAEAPANQLQGSGGVVLGDDFNLYGIRGSLAPIEGLALFGDVGALDPDEGDMGWAAQGGALFVLPLGLPVDLGLRGAIGFGGYDVGERGIDAEATLMTLNGGLLASKKIEMITPYAFLGVNYADMTVDIDGVGEESEDETDAAFALGMLFSVNEQISLYGEFAFIDDPFFGLGAKVNF